MLKDNTSPFRRIENPHILKFSHIELAIGGNIHSKIWEGCTLLVNKDT